MVRRDGGGEFSIGYDIVELLDHGAKTRMTLTDGPYAAGAGHAEAGWSASFDKLAALVAPRRPG